MTGDIGNNTKENPYQSLLAHKQTPPINSSYIVCESTYGDRKRDSYYKSHQNRISALEKIIKEESFKKGKLLIFPAFSIHRTQELMLDIAQILAGSGKNSFNLFEEKVLPQRTIDNLKQNQWNKGDQNIINNALKSSCPDDYNNWMSLIETTQEKRKKKKIETYSLKKPELIDSLIENIKTIDSEVFRILRIESNMANSINKIYARELNKRQKHKHNELLQRNRKLTEYFDKSSEEDIDNIINTIFNSEIIKAHSFLGVHSLTTGMGQSYITQRERYKDIVITGAGMCDAGPIMKNLEQILRNEYACIILTGFMANGTAGAALKEIHDKRNTQKTNSESSLVEKEIIINLSDKSMRESEVKADIIDLSPFYSGHADQRDLIDHIMNINTARETDITANDVTVFINHGTQEARETLKEKLLTYESDRKRDVSRVLLPQKNDKLFDLNSGAYTDEDIEKPLSSSGELTAIYTELRAIRELLQQLCEKQV